MAIYYEEQTTAKGGRPKKILNNTGIDMVEKLAGLQCTEEEICAVIGISRDTARTEDNCEVFSQAYKKGLENGKASLRRKQYEIAMKGNPTLLVWLGKQYLHQAEKLEADVKNEEANKEALQEFLKVVKDGKDN